MTARDPLPSIAASGIGSSMLVTVAKSFVYLTRGRGDLLVLAHPDHPEAGLQVPAGTIKKGETPEQAAARELVEETGIGEARILPRDNQGERLSSRLSRGRQADVPLARR
jgi:8-oxo-dGTP pyrophosphatase MutT (NUDIX family)